MDCNSNGIPDECDIVPVSVVSPGGRSQEVILESDTTINDVDTTLDGSNVIVRGCTLTINGHHTFESVRLERNEVGNPAIVTHSISFANEETNGLYLSIG